MVWSRNWSDGKDAFNLHIACQLPAKGHTPAHQIFHVVYMNIDNTISTSTGNVPWARTKIPNFFNDTSSRDSFIYTAAYTASTSFLCSPTCAERSFLWRLVYGLLKVELWSHPKISCYWTIFAMVPKDRDNWRDMNVPAVLTLGDLIHHAMFDISNAWSKIGDLLEGLLMPGHRGALLVDDDKYSLKGFSGPSTSWRRARQWY
jgi:hypothetical protein